MGGLVLFGCFDDALEAFRPFGLGEGRRVLAVFLQVAKQEVLEVLLGMMHAVGQGLAAENTEKAFDHVIQEACVGV
jgi:hypothetical protein